MINDKFYYIHKFYPINESAKKHLAKKIPAKVTPDAGSSTIYSRFCSFNRLYKLLHDNITEMLGAYRNTIDSAVNTYDGNNYFRYYTSLTREPNSNLGYPANQTASLPYKSEKFYDPYDRSLAQGVSVRILYNIDELNNLLKDERFAFIGNDTSTVDGLKNSTQKEEFESRIIATTQMYYSLAYKNGDAKRSLIKAITYYLSEKEEIDSNFKDKFNYISQFCNYFNIPFVVFYGKRKHNEIYNADLNRGKILTFFNDTNLLKYIYGGTNITDHYTELNDNEFLTNSISRSYTSLKGSDGTEDTSIFGHFKKFADEQGLSTFAPNLSADMKMADEDSIENFKKYINELTIGNKKIKIYSLELNSNFTGNLKTDIKAKTDSVIYNTHALPYTLLEVQDSTTFIVAQLEINNTYIEKIAEENTVINIEITPENILDLLNFSKDTDATLPTIPKALKLYPDYIINDPPQYMQNAPIFKNIPARDAYLRIFIGIILQDDSCILGYENLRLPFNNGVTCINSTGILSKEWQRAWLCHIFNSFSKDYIDKSNPGSKSNRDKFNTLASETKQVIYKAIEKWIGNKSKDKKYSSEFNSKIDKDDYRSFNNLINFTKVFDFDKFTQFNLSGFTDKREDFSTYRENLYLVRYGNNTEPTSLLYVSYFLYFVLFVILMEDAICKEETEKYNIKSDKLHKDIKDNIKNIFSFKNADIKRDGDIIMSMPVNFSIYGNGTEEKRNEVINIILDGLTEYFKDGINKFNGRTLGSISCINVPKFSSNTFNKGMPKEATLSPTGYKIYTFFNSFDAEIRGLVKEETILHFLYEFLIDSFSFPISSGMQLQFLNEWPLKPLNNKTNKYEFLPFNSPISKHNTQTDLHLANDYLILLVYRFGSILAGTTEVI